MKIYPTVHNSYFWQCKNTISLTNFISAEEALKDHQKCCTRTVHVDTIESYKKKENGEL